MWTLLGWVSHAPPRPPRAYSVFSGFGLRPSVFALRPFPRWWLAISVLLVPSLAHSTAPQLAAVLPTGGQRGTELEVTFKGERLQDTEEVLCYRPGIQVLKLNQVSNQTVKAQLKLAADCPLGEHQLRLRTATGLSELRTFFVGAFPAIEEVEPNNEPAKAQKVPLNSTVSGVIQNEDVDCFAVDLKKGQRLSAEVEGMRLGRGAFDPRLAVLDPDGAVLADVDDTWLGMQDPFISLTAQKDGTYLVRIREATYGGADHCQYRLHIGSFPRPTMVFPAGGKAGETNAFRFWSEATGEFTNQISLPSLAGTNFISTPDRFPLFAELESLAGPTPNWIRISDFTNVVAAGTNHDREHATAAEQPPPFALNGIIAEKGQEDWFRFPASKGTSLEINVYARRLHSPLDSVIELHDAAGRLLTANDDAAGADSSMKFSVPESTNYFLRIRDTLGKAGRDYVYRIEVTPAEASLALKIPEVARNDTQSRQFAVVPRGNRFAALVSVKRSNFSGELQFAAPDLPAGVSLQCDTMPANVDSMPLVFEAAADAPMAGKLLDLTVAGTNAAGKVVGHFGQQVDLAEGPNNTSYYGTAVDKFCVAVAREAPFKLRIVEPKVPLVQSGSLPLEIVAERTNGFDEPIQLELLWKPPGVNCQPETTIAKGATNVIYELNANGGAETRTWKITVLGHATVDGGQVYVASQLANLEVAKPYLAGKIETLWVNPGKSGKLTVNLQQAKPFEGKAAIRLGGLPEKVTATEKEISKTDQEVVFDVNVDPNCASGSHRNLFCTVDVKDKDQVIRHTMAQGGILRIVPPKKAEPNVAAAGK